MRTDDEDDRRPGLGPARPPASANTLLQRAGRGDADAFAGLYDLLAARVYGLIRRVVRDPAQSEEVCQEVFVEVWRTAARFDPDRGDAAGWISTLAHRRAVDRVRSAQAATDRERRAAALEPRRPDEGYDDVAEQVETRLEYERVRRCLNRLTALQRESITLAYYRGFTYREVAEQLAVPVPTVKTRMRDGLIRLRDCLGVSDRPRVGDRPGVGDSPGVADRVGIRA